MNIKTILLGAALFSTLGGAAFAGALDNPAPAAPFYTGSTKAMTISNAMSDTGWVSSKECTHAVDPQHNDRCQTAKQLGGAN